MNEIVYKKKEIVISGIGFVYLTGLWHVNTYRTKCDVMCVGGWVNSEVNTYANNQKCLLMIAYGCTFNLHISSFLFFIGCVYLIPEYI